MHRPKARAFSRPTKRSMSPRRPVSDSQNCVKSTPTSTRAQKAPAESPRAEGAGGASDAGAAERGRAPGAHHAHGAGRDEDLVDVERQDAEGVQLLGGPHGGELGGVVGADASREHEADEHRAHL